MILGAASLFPAHSDGHYFWYVAIGLAMVVVLVVASLMVLLLSYVRDIDNSVANLLDLAGQIASQTSYIPQLAATTACHAAVKANYPLTYEKMTHILEELRATAYSTVCPHGRPVMLRLTRREIEKNFDRI